MPKRIGHFRKLPAFKAARGELTPGKKALSYLWSLAIFGAAFLLRSSLDSVLPPGFPFLTFFPAVVIAGFMFGVPQGTMVAIFSGIASWHFFMTPEETTVNAGTVIAVLLYVFVVATDLFLLSLMMSAYRAELLARNHVERLSEEREVLAQELDHRLKNVFATMNAVITLSQRHASTSAELAGKLKERLNSMARSSLLLRGGGPSGPATLSTVIERTLSPFGAGDCSRFTLNGPPIFATGQTAVVLSLILHELGTNAAKYGALSSAHGHIGIDWREVTRESEPEEPRLELVWRESMGPPPPLSEPERKGFGSTLIQRVIATLGGEARIEFPPSGALVTMTIPMSAIARPLAESEMDNF